MRKIFNDGCDIGDRHREISLRFVQADMFPSSAACRMNLIPIRRLFARSKPGEGGTRVLQIESVPERGVRAAEEGDTAPGAV